MVLRALEKDPGSEKEALDIKEADADDEGQPDCESDQCLDLRDDHHRVLVGMGTRGLRGEVR